MQLDAELTKLQLDEGPYEEEKKRFHTEWEQLTDFSQPIKESAHGSGLGSGHVADLIGDFVIAQALSQTKSSGFRL